MSHGDTASPAAHLCGWSLTQRPGLCHREAHRHREVHRPGTGWIPFATLRFNGRQRV